MRSSAITDTRVQPGGGFMPSPGDIRDHLRRDHEVVLEQLEALRVETDAPSSFAQLRLVRRTWVIHALAEETVVYKALEGAEADRASKTRADERFIEHELVEGLFEKLSRSRPGTLEWSARLNVARELITRHLEAEHDDMFTRLGQHFDPQRLREMGRRFELARAKLTMLEEAKAA
jgi:hemerythrin superfamily protein